MEKGVSVTNSSRILFQNCTIKNVLNNGLSFTNTTYCGIVNSKIVNIGNVGVMISGTEEVKDLYKSERMKNLAQDRNFVQNCTLSNAKRAGIGVYNGVGNIVSHNVISDMYRDGIIVSRAAENIVEYNEIFGGQADGIADSGLIYCGGEMISRGNHFRNNYLHDPIKSAVGIYFDERMSDNMAYDNIIVNCPKGIFIHNGKDVSVYNNMILNDAVNGRQDEDDAYPIADWPTYYSGSGQGECVFQKEVISESGSVADFIKSDLYTSETWRQRDIQSCFIILKISWRLRKKWLTRVRHIREAKERMILKIRSELQADCIMKTILLRAEKKYIRRRLHPGQSRNGIITGMTV